MKRSAWRRYMNAAPDWRLGNQMKERLEASLAEVSASGYWRCLDCMAINSREEGEQGQPAHCGRCGSHKLKREPAVFQSSLP